MNDFPTKGIDVNLKDSENRTVLSLLADFNAEKYSKIKSMIQSVANKGDAIKGRYIKPRKHRLLAIPRKDSKPLQQYEPSGNYIPLQYKEGLLLLQLFCVLFTIYTIRRYNCSSKKAVN